MRLVIAISVAMSLDLVVKIESIDSEVGVLSIRGVMVVIPHNHNVSVVSILGSRNVKYNYAEDAIRSFCAFC